MTEPGPDVSARLAWPDDAATLTRLQLLSWQESFGELIGAEALSTLDATAIAEQWSQLITSPPDARIRALVALDRAAARGYILVHPSGDPDADGVADGEIGEFTVDAAHRDAGHGSRLVNAAVDTLRSDRFTRAVWWIDATDDALRAFVTESGWEADGAHRELATPTGATMKQVRLHTSLE
ncbi:N-acetyltransferase family protein [Aeromicrobium sp. CF3.5]|uniref:GNAT family N-acetyltransferase n=1 Tax=Aeromicrobium sp. CF3.5 TaxID=3373078 RepID=UPI003EE7D8E0